MVGVEVTAVDPVAAARQLAGRQAGVVGVAVAVVAGLKPLVPFRQIQALRAVTTAGGGAGVQAGVKVIAVAVVALLVALPDRAVAAAGWAAGVGARVGIDLVAVVADLAHLRLNLAVTAADHHAVVGAAVPGLVVAVIAALIAFVGLEQVRAQDAVAAGRRLARAQAGVVVLGVAVITALSAHHA